MSANTVANTAGQPGSRPPMGAAPPRCTALKLARVTAEGALLLSPHQLRCVTPVTVTVLAAVSTAPAIGE